MRAAGGYRARMYGLNAIGLRRHGFSADRIAALKQAYELLFRSGHRVSDAIKLARDTFSSSQDVLQVADFMEGTKRGICRSVGKEQEGEEE
jgi:UDP-N-acetylglucosamine acyltransferase